MLNPKAISSEIQTEILKSNSTNCEKHVELRSNNLYNLMAWIVGPNSTFDNHDNIKQSKMKAAKASTICTDIESPGPNATSSLSRFLLLLYMYRKTGSSIITDDLLKMRQGISYAETKFTEELWAEWTEKQYSLILNNIQKGAVAILEFGSFDWKNENLRS